MECAAVSSNAVAIQRILAPGTDSHGPNIWAFRVLWRTICGIFSNAKNGGFETALTRLLNHRPRARKAAAGRDPAPYLSPSLRFSTHLLPGGFETALTRLLNHREAATDLICAAPLP